MSRLGKLPIIIPAGVQVKMSGNTVEAKGPKGELKLLIREKVEVEIGDKEVVVSVANPGNKKAKAFWGLYRSLINNLVVGVSDGFEKKLEVNGVGYRVSLSGQKMTLKLGYSHPIDFILPNGISGKIDGKIIELNGADKQLVGETAARIRKLRKPEPYKGKGIKYVDEVILRKEGKTAAKSE